MPLPPPPPPPNLEPWYEDDAAGSASTTKRMADTLASVPALKPFPQVVQKLMGMMQDPDFEVAKITRAVEEDPALASNVLRVANSVLFGGLMPSKTIGQAIVRLGMRALHEMVVSVSVSGMFKDAHGEGRKIRDHCAGTGAVVRVLARAFSPKDVDGLFVAGLMHDLGKLLLLQAKPAGYEALTADPAFLVHDGIYAREREALGFDHAVFGAFVMVAWKIPAVSARLVHLHHQAPRALADPAVSRPLALLRLADAVEPALTPDKPAWKKVVAALCADEGVKAAGVTPEGLEPMAEKLLEARSSALTLFG